MEDEADEEENGGDETDEETYHKKDFGNARSANANWAKKAKTNDARDPTDAGFYLRYKDHTQT